MQQQKHMQARTLDAGADEKQNNKLLINSGLIL